MGEATKQATRSKERLERMSLGKRFYRKVSQTPSSTGCLEWKAATNGKYGIIRSSERPHPWILAHRVAYELHYGPIPAGMDVMHKCDNPKCVNFEHLSVGSRKENMADMVDKGRQRKSAFSEADLESIRVSYRSGLTQREIAMSYGVSRPLISLLLSGKVSVSTTA